MNNGSLRLGIGPDDALDGNRWLMTQLEPMVARAIVPTASDDGRDDAQLMLHAEAADLDRATRRGVPVFASYGLGAGSTGAGDITFTESESLDQRLRGISLRVPELNAARLSAAPGDEVLALSKGEPIWLQRRVNGQVVELSGLGPAQLNGQRHLDWTRDNRQLLEVVPLIHFLRRLAGRRDSPTRIHACLVIDDPNLRWGTFGFLRYRDVAEDAMNHGYHVSVAMIPIDGLLYRPEVIQLFKEYRGQLSVSMHGNNHTREEWNLPDLAPSVRSLAQAVRRIERFERRTGLRVDRVAAPPHGVISPSGLRAASLCGIDAMALDPSDMPAPRRLSGGTTGIGPAVISPERTSLLLRWPVTTELSWFAMHAFLDQPLIIYLHHQDLVDGVPILRETAKRISELGDVEWCSLDEIAQSCYTTRTDGSAAVISLFTPRVRAHVPDGVTTATIECPMASPASAVRIRRDASTLSHELDAPFSVEPGEVLSISVELEQIDPYSIAPPRRHPWPVMRRFATEARDRLQPILRM